MKLLQKIGEVAKTLSTSIRTIRYYEEEGLLSSIRSEGGTRLYSRRHVDRLSAILRLTNAGYSIDVIKVLAKTRELNRSGDESQQAISARLDVLRADIDIRMQQLKQLGEQIAAVKGTVSQCAGCKNKPSSKGCPLCPVRRHLADIELLNLVWDQEE
jgi:DNA-binding transcriptional MerR regulator